MGYDMIWMWHTEMGYGIIICDNDMGYDMDMESWNGIRYGYVIMKWDRIWIWDHEMAYMDMICDNKMGYDMDMRSWNGMYGYDVW